MTTIGHPQQLVAANLRRHRQRRRLTLVDVCKRLATVHVRMTKDNLSRIERGERTITVDQFVALAFALGASPAALLLPPDGDPVQLGTATIQAQSWWRWVCGDHNIPNPTDATEDPLRDLEGRRELLAAFPWLPSPRRSAIHVADLRRLAAEITALYADPDTDDNPDPDAQES